MKKFIVLFLVFLCISFNIINPMSVFAQNTLKQGIYRVIDLSLPQGKFYTVQNFSRTDTAFVQFFDGNGKMIQAINLTPSSLKYDVISLDPNFTIVILGNGEISID